MQIIRPHEFARAFADILDARQSRIRRIWQPWNAKKFTKAFLDNEDSVIEDVAAAFHLHYYGPWWTLDGVIYENIDDVAFPESWEMPTYLSVVIEHENDPRRATFQMNKLSNFNAPLKVLITYPGRPSKRNPDKRGVLLDNCARVLEGADILGDFSSQRRHMIVLGDDDRTEENPDGYLKWRFYEYQRGQFICLSDV